ncbi:MAG: serine protease [Puia sp.]
MKSYDYLTNMPMALGDYASIKNGDRIGYIGFDKFGESTLCVGFISKIDSIKSNGVWLNRLTFSTRELAGYPGSPILNTRGKVIGMIVKASNVKQGNQLIGIVGYSVHQLKYTRYQGF